MRYLIFLFLGSVQADQEISNEMNKAEIEFKDKKIVDDDKSFLENLERLNIPESYRLNDIVFGKSSAPITIVVYTSFTCKYCQNFWIKTFPQVDYKYIKTGKVKIIARQYLDDIGTLEASMLTRCTAGNDSEETLKIFKNIYENQDAWFKSKTPQNFLKKLFSNQNQNWAERCLNNTKISAGLMLSQKEAFSKYKIKSVPAFIVEKQEKIVVIHEGKIDFNTIQIYLEESQKSSKGPLN